MASFVLPPSSFALLLRRRDQLIQIAQVAEQIADGATRRQVARRNAVALNPLLVECRGLLLPNHFGQRLEPRLPVGARELMLLVVAPQKRKELLVADLLLQRIVHQRALAIYDRAVLRLAELIHRLIELLVALRQHAAIRQPMKRPRASSPACSPAVLSKKNAAYQHAQFVRAMSLDLSPVALVPLCAAALDAVQDRADAQGVLVSLDLVYAGSVLAERGAVRRVLDNLLANALAATPPGGSIVLRAVLADDVTARIEVQDSGCGIPPEQQHTIFAPFVRLGGSGSGLGLAIVSEFVAALHGTCGVSSEAGNGSTFWIELRRQKSD